MFIEGLLVRIHNRKYTERETRKFTEATGSGCNKHLLNKKVQPQVVAYYCKSSGHGGQAGKTPSYRLASFVLNDSTQI